MILFSRFVALSLSLFLGGCLSVPPADLPPAPQNVAPDLKLAPALPPYLIQIGDVMDIKLMLNPELNDQVTVRPDGMISTAVAQDVMAYGHTPAQLRELLVEKYKKHLQQPEISVIVRSFAPNRIYVLGEVNSPGEFVTIGPNLTLLQSIARAGGIKNSANVDNIVILRRGATESLQAYSANYANAASGEVPADDVRLASYDVVYVPRTGIANAYLHYNQYIQQFVPPVFSFSYQINPNNNN